MKVSLLKICISIMFLVAFTACDKDEADNFPEKTYALSSIMWKVEDGDNVTVYKKEYPELIFENHSDTIMPIVIVPRDLIKETSFFESDEEDKLNKLIGEDFHVSIPDYFEILSSNNGYVVGGTRAPLFIGVEKTVQNAIATSNKLDLRPQCRLIFSGSTEVRKIRATYTLRFVEEKEKDGTSSDSFEMKGKWTGTFLGSNFLTLTVEEIK